MAKANKKANSEQKRQTQHATVSLTDVEDVPVSDRAGQLIGRIARDHGIDPSEIKLSHVHDMAKSFSVDAYPEVLASMKKDPEVKAVTPPERVNIDSPKSTKVRLPRN